MQQANSSSHFIPLEQLKQLNLNNTEELLYYYPREHIVYPKTQINQIKPETTVTVVGILIAHQIITPRNKPLLTLEKWTIKDKTGQITCTQFYNHHYYKSPRWREQKNTRYIKGTVVIVRGKAKKNNYNQALEIINPDFQIVDPTTASQIKSSITPIYPLSKGIQNSDLQKWVNSALNHYQIKDPLPLFIQNKFNLISLPQAIRGIHQPQSIQELELARTRLVFDEFFYLALLIQKRRLLRQSQAIPEVKIKGHLINQFLRTLPFKLTKDQKRASNEIFHDLQQPIPMNRLLIGDVGSGKTIVAFLAALAAIEAGSQVALMAPTEVLAAQLFHKINQWVEPLKLPSKLLTGSTPTKQRKTLYENLKKGTLPIIIGTHALFQKTVEFNNLGLVIIDEQHRFGVNARNQLIVKGKQPHILSMTATPIPRTLALTVYGDLDTSYIEELPPGRLPVKTYTLTEKSRHKAYKLIRKELEKGHQAYIILPLIDQSDKLELKAAITEAKYLSEKIFPQFNLGLLHGKMNPKEKEEAIALFREGQTSILVSTTVVEVGVDCPNATVMLIEDAHRFGLAQLHQLRGRVGRGSRQSYCFLINNSSSERAIERLNIIKSSNDGFWLASMDLQMRGQGQLLGTQQHGIPEFSLADLTRDQQILEAAYAAAELITKTDPTLTRWPALKQERDKRAYSTDNKMILN